MTSRKSNFWDDDRISAYVDAALDPAERVQFERQLEQQPELRAAVEELQALRQQMKSLPRQGLPADFADRVLRTAEKRMVLGTNQDIPTRPQVDPLGRRDQTASNHRFRWLSAAGLAAAFVLALFVWSPWQRPPQEIADASDQTVGTDDLNDTVAPGAVEEGIRGRQPSYAATAGETARSSQSGSLARAEPEEALDMADRLDSEFASKSPPPMSVAAEQTQRSPYHLAVLVTPRSAHQWDQLQAVLRANQRRPATAMDHAVASSLTQQTAPPSDEDELDRRERDAGQDTADPATRMAMRDEALRDGQGSPTATFDAFLLTAPSSSAMDAFLSHLEEVGVASRTIPADDLALARWSVLIRQRSLDDIRKKAVRDARDMARPKPRADTDAESTNEIEEVSIVALGSVPTAIPSEDHGLLLPRPTPARQKAEVPAEERTSESTVREELFRALESVESPATILLIVERSSIEGY